MSNLWDFIDKKAKEEESIFDKESEKLKKELENRVREDFNKNFPELANGKWSVNYKALNKRDVEILIDKDLKIQATRYNTFFKYIRIFRCNRCNNEIKGNPIDNYSDLKKSKIDFCKICEIIEVYEKYTK